MRSVGSIINTLDYINAHDRTLICVGTNDSAVRIFDEATHRLISSWIALYDEHTRHPSTTSRPSTSTPSKFVMDWNQHLCRIYASSTTLDHIALWDVERERRLMTMNIEGSSGVHCLYSNNNGYCAAGMADGTVRCFDTRAKDSAVVVVPTTVPSIRRSPIIALKADASTRLLSISEAGQLRRWEIDTGSSTELLGSQPLVEVLAADVHTTANVLALATKNALQLKTCFGDLLYDIKHSKFAQVSSLSFHPYRQFLAVGFENGSLSMFVGKNNGSTG